MSRLIALPCRDAELVIGSLIMRARQTADAVLVIDEGSTDRTADVVARAGATLLRRAPSDGEGSGLREGGRVRRPAPGDPARRPLRRPGSAARSASPG